MWMTEPSRSHKHRHFIYKEPSRRAVPGDTRSFSHLTHFRRRGLPVDAPPRGGLAVRGGRAGPLRESNGVLRAPTALGAAAFVIKY